MGWGGLMSGPAGEGGVLWAVPGGGGGVLRVALVGGSYEWSQGGLVSGPSP